MNSPNWRHELANLSALPGQREREVELIYAHLVFCHADNTERELLQALIAELPLSESTRAHLRDSDPDRLLVYRELARGTLGDVIRNALPRACARLGASFSSLLSQFLDTVPIKSRFLRDVTGDFLQYIRDQKIHDIPLYIHELAELEAVRIVVAAHAEGVREEGEELDLEKGLLFHESSRLLNFEYAVHKLSDDEEDRAIPDRRATSLLAFRDAENDVRYVELSSLASLLIARLQSGEALGAAIQGACQESGEELTEAVLGGCAQVLSDLAERGAVLGPAV